MLQIWAFRKFQLFLQQLLTPVRRPFPRRGTRGSSSWFIRRCQKQRVFVDCWWWYHQFFLWLCWYYRGWYRRWAPTRTWWAWRGTAWCTRTWDWFGTQIDSRGKACIRQWIWREQFTLGLWIIRGRCWSRRWTRHAGDAGARFRSLSWYIIEGFNDLNNILKI